MPLYKIGIKHIPRLVCLCNFYDVTIIFKWKRLLFCRENAIKPFKNMPNRQAKPEAAARNDIFMGLF